jgi:ribosome production factor 2
MVADALSAAIGKRTPKTAKGRRLLKRRESQAVEGAKQALILAGNRVSHEAQTLLKDLHKVRTPLSQLFSRTHQMHPFEDVNKLESLCSKYDNGLFAFASSSKKRPLRLIIGRLFDSQLLDMQEFAIKDYKPMQTFRGADATLGAKPLILFQGSTFESDERMKRAKSLLLDYFSGPRPEKVMAQGLEHVVVCSAVEGAAPAGDSKNAPALVLKRFRMKMTKSGSKLPHVELVEVGPSFKMELDRTRDPDRERWKQAIKVPKEVKVQKVKNVKKDSMGKRNARIHMGSQDYNQIHTVHHGESKRKKMREALGASSGAKPAPEAEQ